MRRAVLVVLASSLLLAAPAFGAPPMVIDVPFGLGDPGKGLDPATAGYDSPWQILHATCAQLVYHPDAAPPFGTTLQADAAASLPAISADGLTYTFTIKSGLGFSPPSQESVSAANFRRAIERFAKLSYENWFALIDHIAGIGAFRDGSASSISGVTASGNALTIHLTRRDGGFLAKLAMPYFCAVPAATPLTSVTTPLAMAGPYYVSNASFGAGGDVSSLELKANPNYTGDRPRRIAQFTWLVESNDAARINAVASGSADYTGYIAPSDRAGLASSYGEGSPAEQQGHRQYFTSLALGVRFLALNTDPSSTFSDARLRRAVNLVLDRGALGNLYGDTPTSHYLPPPMPGYAPPELYPLAGDVGSAQVLANQAGLGPGNHATVDLYRLSGTVSVDVANAIAAQLSQIWIDVVQHQLVGGYSFLVSNPTAYDLTLVGWFSDYGDPGDSIDPLLNGAELTKPEEYNLSRFDDPHWNAELDYASQLTGDARGDAYGNLEVDIASGPAPMAALATLGRTHLFSPRLGCAVFHPVFGLDLPRLCERSPIGPGTPVSSGATATSAEPVQATVSSPVVGGAAVSRGPTSRDVPGYAMLGSELLVEAPVASTGSPLSLAFSLDVSTGADASTVAVFRNSSAVSACSGSPGAASPDPCVSARTTDAQGDAHVTVLTSHASTWSFGRPDGAPPSTGNPALSDGSIASGEKTTVSITASDSLSGPGGAEYFVDTDAGVGENRPLMLQGDTFTSAPFGEDLSTGVHDVGVRVRDRAQNWSPVKHAALTVGGSPTAVLVRSFSARRHNGRVIVRWRTAYEGLLTGFEVYRGSVRLSRRLVPATGGPYVVVDARAAPRGAVRYRLRAVFATGSAKWVAAALAR